MGFFFPKRFSLTLACLSLLCLLSLRLSAQQSNDSLLATFAAVEDDSLRVDSMFKIAFKLGFSDPFQGIWLCGQAEAEPWSVGNGIFHARALNLRGVIYYNLGINDLALSYFLEAQKLSDSLGYERGKANAWNNIGNIQESQHRYAEALASYRQARPAFLKIGNQKNAVVALTNIGNAYRGLGEYDRAIEVCDSALLELKEPDDAATYALVYGFLGDIYNAKKEYATAQHYMDLKIEKAIEAEDEYARAEALLNRGRMRLDQHLREEALADVNLALEISQAFGASDMVIECYDVLAQIAKENDDPALALDWMEKSKALSDSVHTEQSETALANYQALYDVKQKDAEIKLLNKDNEIQTANLWNLWYLFGLVSLGLVAMVVIVILLYRGNRARSRVNQELQTKNVQIQDQHEQIATQNKELTNQNERLNILNHEMEGMMHVVAHDLKAPLNSVFGLISAVEEEGELNDAQEKMLDMAKKVTLNAGNLVKDLVELGNVEQQSGGIQKVEVRLQGLLQDIVTAFSAEADRKSITIETMLPDGEAPCQTEPLMLRRVLENLISNALKFSPAGKSVVIALTQSAGFYRISIQDQGPGISPADQKNLYRKFHKLSARPTGGESSSGLGLAIVKTLVEQLGGEIALTSELGQGSTFEVSIPCN